MCITFTHYSIALLVTRLSAYQVDKSSANSINNAPNYTLKLPLNCWLVHQYISNWNLISLMTRLSRPNFHSETVVNQEEYVNG